MDGETDWKLRKALRFTQNIAEKKNLSKIQGSVTTGESNANIYEFQGVFKAKDELGVELLEPISLDNTLWANTYVTSGYVYGLVIYTGKDTKSAMNSKKGSTKIGILDQEINFLTKVLFVLMAFLALFIVWLTDFRGSWVIQFFRHLLLFSCIIPISLRVNLEFAKVFFCQGINNDSDIEGSIARNSKIPEELARIEYVLSDKTGTLTQNEMSMKKLSTEKYQFGEENFKEMSRSIKRGFAKSSDLSPFKKIKEKDVILREIMLALSLCHNVSPVIENGERILQASSPDEIALVTFASSMGINLQSRSQTVITISDPFNSDKDYQILAIFPFSSTTKRMGIILKDEEKDEIVFYLKGADAIMKSKVAEVKRSYLMEECENLAREGLRTLVFTKKVLSKMEYEEWKELYDAANCSLIDREENVNKVIESLENRMELLGISGVEDKLQEDVSNTIVALRQADINVWMLTGDKIETATCIAISTGLKAPDQEIFVMKEIEDELQIQNSLNEFNNRTNHILIIDGSSLNFTLSYFKKLFFEVACKSPAVVCCRCSPTQKAVITESIRLYTGKKTLGIGDGGNDVGMILAADVGVGIVGREGRQAALASDFSIHKFKYLSTLLLWHGRLSYKRSATLAQFVIHRGFIISLIQFIFSLIFYYVAIPFFNGWLVVGYATVFTLLPVFCLVELRMLK